MRLTKVILGVDDSEYFHQTIRVSAESWRTRVDVTPVIGFVGREDPPRLDGSEIISIPPLPDAPTAFQAQCLRLLLPGLFPDDVLITSDADIIPLSARYFHDGVSGIPPGNFVVYRPFELIPEGIGTDLDRKEVPICYNAARGSVWAEIFGVTDLAGLRLRLAEWYERFRHDPERFWTADQILLHEHLHRWDPDGLRTSRLGDRATGHRRLHVSDVSRDTRRRRGTIILPRSVLRATDLHLDATAQRHPETAAALFDRLGLAGNDAGQARGVPPFDAFDSEALYASHIAPLSTAVLNTRGPVLEMGTGRASTELLHALCGSLGRELVSAETSRAWLERFVDLETEWHTFVHVPVYPDDGSTIAHPEVWDRVGGERRWGVVFVDHSPGTRRAVDIHRLRGQADVFVVHDTEEPGYGYRAVLPLFRYTYTYRHRPAWTTVVSDTIDVRAWFKDDPAGSPRIPIVSSLAARFGLFPPLLTVARRLKHRMAQLVRR